MTSNDLQIDLVINQLTRAQYERLESQGLIDDTQLYMITDDPTTAQQISSQLSDYYPKSETSSSTELDTKFNSLSTYSDIASQLSNDGYIAEISASYSAESRELSISTNAQSAVVSIPKAESKVVFKDWID